LLGISLSARIRKLCAQEALEAALEVAAETEDLWLPLPEVGNPGESLIVQLVTATERELAVIVGEANEAGRLRARVSNSAILQGG
jgi:hypothetical protein